MKGKGKPANKDESEFLKRREASGGDYSRRSHQRNKGGERVDRMARAQTRSRTRSSPQSNSSEVTDKGNLVKMGETTNLGGSEEKRDIACPMRNKDG